MKSPPRNDLNAPVIIVKYVCNWKDRLDSRITISKRHMQLKDQTKLGMRYRK